MKKRTIRNQNSDLGKTPPVNRPEAENTGSMPGFHRARHILFTRTTSQSPRLRENLATVACRNFPLYA